MGKRWFDKDVLELAMNSMEKDFSLPFSVSGGMPTFKKTLAFSFFLRFWHEAAAELNLATVDEKVDRDIISEINRGISSGIRDDENPYEQRVVGKQIPHLSGLKQATGEAEFIDDMPKFDGELYGGLVLSKRAHAKLLKYITITLIISHVQLLICFIQSQFYSSSCSPWCSRLRRPS